MTTYTVPERNIGWLREKVEKLNKRAERLDVRAIELNVVREELRPYGVRGEVRKYLVLEVVGEAPVLMGWKFVATLQHVQDNGDSATIIHAVPGETVPTQYRETDGRWCDHCRAKRMRNDTFIVQHVGYDQHGNRRAVDYAPGVEGFDGFEYKQVGRQCLKDFLGHSKPEMYADWAQDIGLLDSLFRGASEDDGRAPVSDRIFLTESYLTATVAAIRTTGWVSGKQVHEAEEAGDYSLIRTRDVATQILLGENAVEPTKADRETALKVIEWGRGPLVEQVARKPDNDYIYNLATVLRLDALNYRMLGIAASAVPAYERDAKPRESEAERAARSNFVGSPGLREQFVVTVTGIRSITYADGTAGTVINYNDMEGNELVWFTSSRGEFEPGKTYRVSATVKRHSEYHGIKQTALNRVSILKVVA